MRKAIIMICILVIGITGCSNKNKENDIRLELAEDSKVVYEFLREQELQFKEDPLTAISDFDYALTIEDNNIIEPNIEILTKYNYDDLNKKESFLKSKLDEALIIYIDVIQGAMWGGDEIAYNFDNEWKENLNKFYESMEMLHKMKIDELISPESIESDSSVRDVENSRVMNYLSKNYNYTFDYPREWIKSDANVESIEIRAELSKDAKTLYKLLTEVEKKLKKYDLDSIKEFILSDLEDNDIIVEYGSLFISKYDYEDLNKYETFLKSRLEETIMMYLEIFNGVNMESTMPNHVAFEEMVDIFYESMDTLHKMKISNLKETESIEQRKIVEKKEAVETINYINNRFGYSVDYPREWGEVKESANGDGCILLEDRGFDIRVYASDMMDNDFQSYLMNNYIGWEYNEINVIGAEQAMKLMYYGEDSYQISLVAQKGDIIYTLSMISMYMGSEDDAKMQESVIKGFEKAKNSFKIY